MKKKDSNRIRDEDDEERKEERKDGKAEAVDLPDSVAEAAVPVLHAEDPAYSCCSDEFLALR